MVTLEHLDEAAVFLGCASSTRPLKNVMKTNIRFSILGPHYLTDEMITYLVCCTNAYKPDEGSEALIPWSEPDQSAAVSPQTDVIIDMSTTEGGWSFDPTDQLLHWQSRSSPHDTFHRFGFLLKRDVKKGRLKSFRCCCRIGRRGRLRDSLLRPVFFHTPSHVAKRHQLDATGFEGAYFSLYSYPWLHRRCLLYVPQNL